MSFKQIFKVTVSFIGIVNSVHAAESTKNVSAENSKPSVDFDQTKGHDNIRDLCSLLLDLEPKDNLTQEEHRAGVLLFEMIQRISEQPIEYCQSQMVNTIFQESSQLEN